VCPWALGLPNTFLLPRGSRAPKSVAPFLP
jgi:hypothetical protein